MSQVFRDICHIVLQIDRFVVVEDPRNLGFFDEFYRLNIQGRVRPLRSPVG